MKRLAILLLLASLQASGQLQFKNFGFPNYVCALLPDGDYVWVGTINGLYKRTWGGAQVAHYGIEDGLSHSHVSALAKDPVTGAIWIGTGGDFGSGGNGITKFQNYQWTVYNKANTGINIRSITGIAVDQYGNVWASTYGYGILKFDGTTWTVINPIGGSIYCSLAIDQQGNIWCGTWGQGIFKYDGSSWKKYTESDGLGRDYVISMGNDLQGNIWFGHYYGGGVTKYNGSSFTVYNTGNSSICSNEIAAITVDNAGNMYFGSWGSGVSKYTGSVWTTYHTGNSGLISNQIRSIAFDSHDNLWLGTENSGISKFTGSAWLTFAINEGIPQNVVTDLDIDSKNRKWITTNSNGFVIYNDTTWTYYNPSTGTPSMFEIYDLDLDANDVAWIAGNTYVYKYNGVTFTNYNTNLLTVAEDVAITDNGTVWISYRSWKGLGVAKLVGASWVNYNKLNSGICSDSISQTKAHKNDVWFCSTLSGLSKYNGTTWTTYNKSNSGLRGNTVQDIVFDAKGLAWIFTSSGICTFDGTTWKNITSVTGKSMEFDKDSIMWLASNSGLNRFDGTSKLLNYTTLNSQIIDNNVNKVMVDKYNRKWILTGTGVSLISCAAPEADFTFDIPCYPQSTTFTNTSVNSDIFTSYHWDINKDGSIEYTTKDISHVFPNYGNFNVKLKTVNAQCKDSVAKAVAVNQKPDVKLTSSAGNTICFNSTTTLTTQIVNYDAGLTYSFEWSTGTTKSAITVSDSGQYIVNVFNNNCASDPDTIDIAIKKPYDSSVICMVRVDPQENKNMIIWERSSGKDIEYYNIYKVYGSIYSPVGSVPFDSSGYYIDYTSLPDILSEKYAISISDECKNESSKSPFHQELLLQINKSIEPNKANLIWKNYVEESGTLTPDSFFIYKGKTKDKLSRIHAMPYDPGDIQLYTDVDFDGISAYYQVALHFPYTCNPTLLKAESGPYTQSLSNIAEYKTEKAGLENNSLSASAYPNPFNDNITLSYSLENQEDIFVEVIDALGTKVVISEFPGQSAGSNSIKISLSQLPSGIYTLKIIAGENIQTLMCVKQ